MSMSSSILVIHIVARAFVDVAVVVRVVIVALPLSSFLHSFLADDSVDRLVSRATPS